MTAIILIDRAYCRHKIATFHDHLIDMKNIFNERGDFMMNRTSSRERNGRSNYLGT